MTHSAKRPLFRRTIHEPQGAPKRDTPGKASLSSPKKTCHFLDKQKVKWSKKSTLSK